MGDALALAQKPVRPAGGVVGDYLSTHQTAAAHGLTRNEGSVPDYRPRSIQLAICREAIRDRTIGDVCRRFYRDLPLNADRTECPFGVALLYQRTRVSDQHVCLYQQLGFNPKPDHARDLPRVPKKAAMSALGVIEEFDLVACREKFQQAKELLSTLLTGRVAESIRGLSHHLLTPLQGAMADAQRLGEDALDQQIPIRLGRNLAEVDSAAKQIQILLSDEAEFTPQKLRKVRVPSMVGTALTGVTAEAQRRNIRIEHTISQHAREVQAIPDQFSLVLSNLIQNGIKYSFDGSVDHPRFFRIRYATEGENIVIGFSNEGCGIDQDEITRRKIFELGYRGRSSSDRARSGTGTGLYIADKIASAHDAVIRVTSRQLGSGDFSYPMHENRFELVWPVYSRHST